MMRPVTGCWPATAPVPPPPNPPRAPVPPRAPLAPVPPAVLVAGVCALSKVMPAANPPPARTSAAAIPITICGAFIFKTPLFATTTRISVPGSDGAAARADGLADPDLTGPLVHRHQHDVHDPDAADEQRDPADRSEQQRERAGDGAEGRERVVLVRHGEVRARWVGDVVALQQDVVHVACREVHRVAGRRLDHDLRDLVQAPSEDVLRRRERNEDLVVAYETEGAALHTEHADDAEVQDPRALGCAALPSTTEGLPQLDRLADRVNVAEEVGRGRRTENGDLRVHVQVRGREEVSA